MNKTDSSENDWNILGELELSPGPSMDSAMQTWFAEILAPLRLPAEFVTRVLNSAQDAAGRALQPGNPARETGHIHLLLLIPAGDASHGGTWGFFRIEKTDQAPDEPDSNEHSIEFYLYVE